MDSSGGGLGALLSGGISCVFYIALYAYLAMAQMTMAKRLGVGNEWMAWVPIANLIQLVQMADKEMWWVILFFVPIANIVVACLCYNEVARKLGKPDWLGWLMVVPCVNCVIPGYLAWGK